MVLEHVHIKVDSNKVAAYSETFDRARPLVQSQDGCLGCRLLPKVGAVGEFLLLIEWESKAHHTEGFRCSPEYQEWSRLLHPFYDASPTVNYYQLQQTSKDR